MKLWAGRFQNDTSALMDDFNSSIAVDSRMYKQDIQGSIAHAKMLVKCGIITAAEGTEICEGLMSILNDLRNGAAALSVDAEDVHMNVETLLIQRIGEAGKRLHTARSRNDQVALDVRMYLRDAADEIVALLEALQSELLEVAGLNVDVILPGYTHMQRAQPISFAHHLLAYCEMFSRDAERIGEAKKRINVMPLGAGALAGTTYLIDREYVAKELGFDAVCLNSIDAVSDRDFVLEFGFDLSLVMMHLSRFSEEIILWSTTEFGFITLDDAYSTGSSIMPQKKNPDAAELVRGKTGRVFGDLMGLLTMMKGLPLAYNKDMQEDKELVFDSLDTVAMCLRVFTDMIKTMKVNEDAMLQATLDGFLNATDLADYLVTKGESFRNAHEIVGQVVVACEKQGKRIEDLTLEALQEFSARVKPDVYEAISIENCVSRRKTLGGTAFDEVRKQLARLRGTSIENGKEI
ncbi:MAG TPA: argininosuccinate lyase [Bacillota bacterium]|nr:argininosuccinate lyase [Bacillota bacterium]